MEITTYFVDRASYQTMDSKAGAKKDEGRCASCTSRSVRCNNKAKGCTRAAPVPAAAVPTRSSGRTRRAASLSDGVDNMFVGKGKLNSQANADKRYRARKRREQEEDRARAKDAKKAKYFSSPFVSLCLCAFLCASSLYCDRPLLCLCLICIPVLLLLPFFY